MTEFEEYWKDGLIVCFVLVVLALIGYGVYLDPLLAGGIVAYLVGLITVPYILGRIAHYIL